MALARAEDRARLEACFRAALARVNAHSAVRQALQKRQDILEKNHGRIWIFGVGKASAAMAQAAEDYFESKSNPIAGGLVVTKDGHGLPLKHLPLLEASHPVPDERGMAAAERMMREVSAVPPSDVILFLLSGGASALLPLPSHGMTLHEKQHLTQSLLKSGANIHEMNAVRKHCSRLKGGRLALASKAWHLMTLAISDVPGDAPESIGSGPTVPDPTTLEQCRDILKRFKLTAHLSDDETPKVGNAAFARTSYHIIACNRDAVEAAAAHGKASGLPVSPERQFFSESIDDAVLSWELLEQQVRRESKVPMLLVCGGEPTVKVTGSGQGGRNLELAMRLAMKLKGKFTFLSAGTDGSDGTTPAAGAFCDETTLARAQSAGLSAQAMLADNDSYGFFQTLGDVFTTGPTQTNVMDLQLLLLR